MPKKKTATKKKVAPKKSRTSTKAGPLPHGTPPTVEVEVPVLIPQRDEMGRFVQGQSGNPKGKPVGTKSWITIERENLELVLRKYLSDPKQMKKATAAVDRLFTLAMESDDKVSVQAMKVLFDKILPTPKAAEPEATEKAPSVHIVIENATKIPEVTVGKVIDQEES